MVPNGHINWYFGPIQSKSWPKLENGQKWSWFEHCSEWPQIDILAQFSQKVDQNWEIAKSKVGSNIAQNDPKWSLIVLSIDYHLSY